MKKIISKTAIIVALLLIGLHFNAAAQKYGTGTPEQFGRTLNAGLGVGYYGYVGHPIPFAMIDYEFGIARNITLAPFVGGYTYTGHYYWGDNHNPDRQYNYRVSAVPVGLKCAYYFDELLHASPKWDFYAAASIGFVFRDIVWDDHFNGDSGVIHEPSSIYDAAHIGARYHINPNVGIYLDLSTGFSTFGVSFKL